MEGINPEDAARELDKAADALKDALRYFEYNAAMNAALYLAREVRISPLGMRVQAAAEDARRTAERFRLTPAPKEVER